MLVQALAGIDPWAAAGFLAVWTFGFVTSLHCALMCGPLVCARLGPTRSAKSPGLWLYNAGRLISYPLVGAVAATVGGSIGAALAALGTYVAVTVATLLAAAGIAVFLRHRSFAKTLRLSALIEQPLFKSLRRLGSWSPSAQLLALGGATALLPCATLSPVILLAASSGNASTGAMLLFAFALGTTPAMVAAPLLPTLLVARLPPRWLHVAAAMLLLVGSAATVLRLSP
jgi:sulfite exporter TauE/SafE